MKLIRYIIPTLMAIVLMAALPVVTLANPGLQVSNTILLTNVSPGQTLTFKMTVGIGATDPAADIGVQVEGLTQSLDGTNAPSAAAGDTSPYSARSFVSVDKSSFQLQPGTSQDVTATISVPQDVGTGGRYAIIHIATQAAPGAAVSILSAVDVPVVLTVTGSQLIQTGKITALTIGQPVSGQPLSILTTFQDTGNYHFKVKGQVTVSDSQGKLLDTIDMPLASSSVVPTMSMQLKATFTPQSSLPAGVYSVDSKVMLADGTVLNEDKGSFTVGTSGLAPSPTPVQTSTATSNPASPKSPISWLAIVGAIAGVIVVGVLVFLVVKRRHN